MGDNTAGIIFNEANGDETGGIGTATPLGGRRQAMLIFDYTHQITDGVMIRKWESEDGEDYWAGLSIADRRPYRERELLSSQGIERIALENTDQHAALVISGTDGKARIRLAVSKDNEVSIDVLNAQGKVVGQIWPDNRHDIAD